MTEHSYIIQNEVFKLFPGYIRGLIIAKNVRNGDSPKELIEQLRCEENKTRLKYSIDSISGYERIANWREAFRRFNAKPSEFRSSIESMARRVLRGDSLPSINALVDIGNIISLRYMIPVGGHAIDHIIGNLSLRIATGDEDFISFGSELLEHPDRGEIIFSDENIVLTRRWTWRQGKHTLIMPDTKSIEYNLDGLPPCRLHELEAAGNDLADLVKVYCHGDISMEILSESQPSIPLDL